MRRCVGLSFLALLVAMAAPSGAAGAEECRSSPDPVRWSDAGTPDVGRQPLGVAVHRGAAELAPENTLDAYRYAIAYGVEMIEIDVQQLKDGRFVSFHDSTVDRKTDGSGPIGEMSYDEVRQLNAADNDKWRGSEYDPAQIPSLEEVLELARATDTRIYFDVKESVIGGVADMANLAAEYGVIQGSLWRTFDPARDEAIKSAQPGAELMLSNYDRTIGPETFFAATPRYRWFGSDLEEYSPEKIAAIHDGCSLAILNTYGGGVTGSEAGDTLHARSIGADAVQVNNPDVAVAALQRPVETMIEVARPLNAESRGRVTACLVDRRHRFGLPGKQLRFRGKSAPTRRNGCATFLRGRVPPRRAFGPTQGRQVVFGGDSSALPSRVTLPGRTVQRGTARLRAPRRGCGRHAFTVAVLGRSLRRVVFSLDGRRLPHSGRRGGQVSVRIVARRLALGPHQVAAKVWFDGGSLTKPRVLRAGFSVC